MVRCHDRRRYGDDPMDRDLAACGEQKPVPRLLPAEDGRRGGALHDHGAACDSLRTRRRDARATRLLVGPEHRVRAADPDWRRADANSDENSNLAISNQQARPEQKADVVRDIRTAMPGVRLAPCLRLQIAT